MNISLQYTKLSISKKGKKSFYQNFVFLNISNYKQKSTSRHVIYKIIP